MNLTKLSIQTFLFNAAGFIPRIISGIMIARILGPADRGLLTIVILYPSLFLALGNFNLGLSVIHSLGKKEYKKEEFAGSLLFFSITISIGLLMIFFTCYFFGNEYFFKNIPVSLLFLGITILPFNLFIYLFSSFFQGLGKIKWYNIINQLPQFLAPITVIGFWLFWKFTILEGILVNLTGALIVSFVIWRLIIKEVPRKWQINKKQLSL